MEDIWLLKVSQVVIWVKFNVHLNKLFSEDLGHFSHASFIVVNVFLILFEWDTEQINLFKFTIELFLLLGCQEVNVFSFTAVSVTVIGQVVIEVLLNHVLIPLEVFLRVLVILHGFIFTQFFSKWTFGVEGDVDVFGLILFLSNSSWYGSLSLFFIT